MNSKRNPIAQTLAFNLDRVQLMIAGDVVIESDASGNYYFPSIFSTSKLKDFVKNMFPLSPRNPDGQDLRQLLLYAILPVASAILTENQYENPRTSQNFIRAFGQPSAYSIIHNSKLSYKFLTTGKGGYPHRLYDMDWNGAAYNESTITHDRDIKLSSGDIVVGWLEHTRRNMINSEYKLTDDGENSYKWEIQLAAPIFAIFKKK